MTARRWHGAGMLADNEWRHGLELKRRVDMLAEAGAYLDDQDMADASTALNRWLVRHGRALMLRLLYAEAVLADVEWDPVASDAPEANQ